MTSSTDTAPEPDSGFSAEERSAMKERAKELRAAGATGRTGQKKVDPEVAVLEKIAEMPEDDRVMAERIHALVKEHAPQLGTKTWYGMPAYTRDGKVLCFFQAAAKFGARYATLGFEGTAHLDEGDMWPTTFALLSIGPAEEERIVELLRRAVG
ncbi:MAG: iron chaperone [Pauljensenia sp.]